MWGRAATTALIICNLVLGCIVTYQALELKKPGRAYGDHIQQVRMDVPNRVLIVRLGTSKVATGPVILEPEPGDVIVLTPRAAIQLDVELQRMFALIQDQAARSSTLPRSAAPPADRF